MKTIDLGAPLDDNSPCTRHIMLIFNTMRPMHRLCSYNCKVKRKKAYCQQKGQQIMLPQLFSSFSQLVIAQDDLMPVRLPPGVADVQPARSGVVERLDDELVEVEALDKLHRLTPVVERGKQDVRCLAPCMLRAPPLRRQRC